MIEPMIIPNGYIPLCSALHWIMTEGGRLDRNLEDIGSWERSVDQLLPLITTGAVEVLGVPDGGGLSEKIPSHCFAGVQVPPPVSESWSIPYDAPWISCAPYTDEEHWQKIFNDEFFVRRDGPAAWTHLQVKKADVLQHFQHSPSEANVPPLSELLQVPERPKGKPGAKPRYDWEEVELLVQRELDERGDFNDANQVENWRSQADLERTVADHFSNQNGETPAVSTVRKRIVPMVNRWRLKERSRNGR
jgi:hypothetical protein